MKRIQVLHPSHEYWLRIFGKKNLNFLKKEESEAVSKIMYYINEVDMSPSYESPLFFLNEKNVFRKDYSNIIVAVGVSVKSLDKVVESFKNQNFKKNGLGNYVFSDLTFPKTTWVKAEGLFKLETPVYKDETPILMKFTDYDVIENYFY